MQKHLRHVQHLPHCLGADQPKLKLLTILSVVTNEPSGPGAYIINFSGTFHYDSSGLLDNFTIDGNPVIGASKDPTALEITVSAPTSTGLAWALTAQPSQITDRMAPASGLTVAP